MAGLGRSGDRGGGRDAGDRSARGSRRHVRRARRRRPATVELPAVVAPEVRGERRRGAGQPSPPRPRRRRSARPRRSPRTPRSTSPSGPAARTPRTSPWPRRTRSSSARASRDGGRGTGRRPRSGPFTITALPAVDGLGDPQVSWLVEAGGTASCTSATRSSTATGGGWPGATGRSTWCFAPINGPVVDFPHLQPPSPLAAAMEPEQAALAGELLGARTVVPIHYDGFGIDPWYRPVDDAAGRFGQQQRAAPMRPACWTPVRASSSPTFRPAR